MGERMTVKSVVEDGYYVALAPDGTEIGRRAKRDKCLEDISAYGDEHCIYGEYRIRQPEVRVTLGPAKFSHGLVIPTPGGRVDSRFPDGDDGGAAGPSTPAISQPVVVSDTQIDISLHTLATGGTAPITYILERSISGANSWTVIASGTDIFGPEEGYGDTGLAPDTQYDYRVKAVDASSRESGYANIATARTLETPDPLPDLPGNLTGSAVGSVDETTISNVTWNALEGADSYRVICVLAGGDGDPGPQIFVLDTTTTATNYPVISGLNPSQWYYVRVCPLNAAGMGGCGPRMYVQTEAHANPSTPTIAATEVGHAQVDVTLTAQSTSTAMPITYVLERSSTSSTAGFSQIASGVTLFEFESGFEDTAVAPDTQYWYRTKGVDALNAESSFSTVVTATTEPFCEEALPGTPTGLAIDTVTQTALNDWSWNAVSGATAYRRMLGTGDGQGGAIVGIPLIHDSTAAGTTFAGVSGLTPGQEYYGRIQALNCAGLGQSGTRVFKTTLEDDDPPPPPPPPDIDVLNFYDHSNEPIGPAVTVVGKMTKHTDPSSAGNGTDWVITNVNPILPGGKHFKTRLNKDNAGHVRTERSVAPISTRNYIPINDAEDNFRAQETYWYGILMRVDEKGSPGYRGFPQQWHTAAAVGGSPVLALRGHSVNGNNGLVVYYKDVHTNVAQSSSSSIHSNLILTESQLIGITHAYIWEIYWDTRRTGGQGIVNLYIDNNPTPVYTRVGRNNAGGDHVIIPGKEDKLFIPYFKWGNYGHGSHTGTHGQSHAVFVMARNANRQGVLDALRYDEVVG